MHYINIALSPSRLLNHKKQVIQCSKFLDGIDKQLSSRETLKKAGHIELQLTDKCNLRCSFCRFREQENNHIKFEWIEKIIQNIAPKAITVSGGGEPTCYPQFPEAINYLSSNNSIKIGLITNGVQIPEGSWHNNISWMRVSLYSIVNGKYSGRDSSTRKNVIDNIEWYLTKTKIPKIGVQFLFYKDNIHELSRFVTEIYCLFKRNKIDINKIYIQFKAAYLSARPSILSNKLHQKNNEFLPSNEQLENAIAELKMIEANNRELASFLKICSNLNYLYNLLDGGLKRMRDITNPRSQIAPNFDNCYFCLAHRLITQKGDIYPCATLANHRNVSFSICNINNIEIVKDLKDRILFFYKASTEVCNSNFCLYSKHNHIFEEYLKSKGKTTVNNEDIFL